MALTSGLDNATAMICKVCPLYYDTAKKNTLIITITGQRPALSTLCTCHLPPSAGCTHDSADMVTSPRCTQHTHQPEAMFTITITMHVFAHEKNLLKICGAKGTLLACPDKGTIRCAITPESAMHSSSMGVHAYQTVTALIISPNVVFTERGQQKEFGWLLKQEMIQQVEAAKRNPASGPIGILTDELDISNTISSQTNLHMMFNRQTLDQKICGLVYQD